MKFEALADHELATAARLPGLLLGLCGLLPFGRCGAPA